MKKQTLNNCSNNQLNEAINLVNSLIGEIEQRYLHVEIMPASILKSIKDFQTKLFAEYDKREDQF